MLNAKCKISTPLSEIIRTTSFHIKRLNELGIKTVQDLFLYFPHRYTDQRDVCKIIDIQIDAINTIRGTIKSIHKDIAWKKRRMAIVTALISDESSSIEAVWFNQPYLLQKLKPKTEIMLSGKAKYDVKRGKIYFQNPNTEEIRKHQVHTARIVPIYHETDLRTTKRVSGKISSKWIREKLFPLLPFAQYFQEFLPENLLKTYKLMPYSKAIQNAHFPSSEKMLDAAKYRLAFNELFLLQLAALYKKYLWRKIAKQEKKQISANWELMKKFTKSLPWSLTNAQKKAIYEILKDLEHPFPMSRLLEGDTGSGKTVVAAAAILNTIKAGWQTCVLAPTEILAQQHFNTLNKTLKSFDIKPALLTGSTPSKEKIKIIEDLKSSSLLLVVGTHALLQENIGFLRLGLAIIDEQHRFGVKQRELIKSYGSPHVLSLSATPIPRTLALILYGDQDLSILDEMPPNRQKIITRIVPEEKRRDAYEWINQEIEKGRQAFIVFPLIEESEALQIKAAAKEFEKLQNEIFPHLKCGLLHGQMPAQIKSEVMKNFKDGKIQILVSTAVVEVGVDIPNAVIMMIEGAERFGLAQLHQFRGRVGRGADQSYCLLFPTLQNPQILKRLHALVKYDSGFRLAEVDLQLRGPGEVYGTSQSGIPDLKMANLSDALTIKKSREAAQTILNEDPELNKYTKLREKILEQENVTIDY